MLSNSLTHLVMLTIGTGTAYCKYVVCCLSDAMHVLSGGSINRYMPLPWANVASQ